MLCPQTIWQFFAGSEFLAVELLPYVLDVVDVVVDGGGGGGAEVVGLEALANNTLYLNC